MQLLEKKIHLKKRSTPKHIHYFFFRGFQRGKKECTFFYYCISISLYRKSKQKDVS